MKIIKRNGKTYKEIKAPLRRQSNLNGDDHILGATFLLITVSVVLASFIQVIKILFS
jgi:hypothetical protein